MKMKRLVSILIVFAICLSFSAFSVGAEPYNVSGESKLYALGILDKQTDDMQRPVTRIEMVKYAVRLFGPAITYSQAETPFADVSKENSASGEVNFAVTKNIISSAPMFYPNRTVRYEEAVKMVVSALEYGDYANRNGGYPEGYITTAQELGLLKGIEAVQGDGLTLSGALVLLENAVESKVCNPTLIIDRNGKTMYVYDEANDSDNVLGKRFGISKYDAYISEFKVSDGIIKAEIISKQKNDLNAKYASGDVANLVVSKKANLGDIKYTYCDIYVNENDELVFANPDKRTEIYTGYIYEVNKSHNNAPQYPSYIETIALESSEDYIDVSSECRMYFNGKEAVSGEAYPYVGAFCRMVVYDDEIIALEAWDMEEGGIVKSVGDDDITYIKGETSSAVISSISSYKDVTIYINGIKSELWALTTGTLFDVYKSEDNETIIIVASTRAITDTFDTYSSDEVAIGGDLYPLSEEYDVYYSLEEENYKKTADYYNLLGRTVTAYMDYAGYVRYVRPVLDDEKNKEYYSFILGYNQQGLSEPQLLAYIIDGDNVIKNTYKIRESVVKNQSLLIENIKNETMAISSAENSAKNEALKNAEIIYKIRINSAGEITSLRPADKFSEPVLNKYYSSGQNGYSVNDLTGDARANTSNPRVYFDNATICALYYNEDNGIVIRTVPWANLKARSASGIWLTPFADAGASDVEMMLMRGNVEAIGYTRIEYVKRGLLTDIMKGYDSENDKEVISLKIDGKAYTVSKYKNMLDGVTEAAYVIYAADNPFLAKDEVKLNNVFNLSGSPDSWVLAEPQQVGIHKDEIDKIDSRRVHFTSGDAWYMDTTVPVYEIVESNGRVKFAESYRGNVPHGAEAWYIYHNYEVRALFYR